MGFQFDFFEESFKLLNLHELIANIPVDLGMKNFLDKSQDP
jgi:hypothetical protein